MHISPNRIVFYHFLIKYFFLQRVKGAKPTVDVYVLSRFWTCNSFSDFISNFFLLYENTEITSKNNNPALHLRREMFVSSSGVKSASFVFFSAYWLLSTKFIIILIRTCILSLEPLMLSQIAQ